MELVVQQKILVLDYVTLVHFLLQALRCVSLVPSELTQIKLDPPRVFPVQLHFITMKLVQPNAFNVQVVESVP